MNKYDLGKLVVDNPKIKKRRSYIPYMKHKASVDFNASGLYPLDKPIEVLPGDTFKLSHSLKLRMSNPPKVPVMDQLVFDLYFFYTPLRILWDNFDSFITGDTGTDWTIISDLSIPKLEIESSFVQGSLMDFLGLYHGDFTESSWGVNALPFRAYYAIWNHYFRYEPLQSEVYYSTGDSDVLFDSTDCAACIADFYDRDWTNFFSVARADAVATNVILPVNKLADYFTRCLPQPQAGPDVQILGLDNAVLGSTLTTGDPLVGYLDTAASQSGSGALKAILTSGESSTTLATLSNGDLNGIGGGLTGVTGNTIRDFRMAMAISQLLETDARFGRRINEFSIGHYGVTVPDYRIDFPEFLSHKRIYINLKQVIQSSASEANSPQGNVGAWSETTDTGFDFIKSFVEHGFIMTLGCVRILNRTYSQGIDRLWRRVVRFDFYDPILANISDTPVYKEQLYTDDTSVLGEVFGYQEAWAEYKFCPNHIANHMRPNVSDTLAVWNYAEYYGAAPVLSEAWIIEDSSPIDRTMYLQSSNTVSQFILDIYYDYDVYRTMPLHSLPGGLTNSW